jgi:hypothetical protein
VISSSVAGLFYEIGVQSERDNRFGVLFDQVPVVRPGIDEHPARFGVRASPAERHDAVRVGVRIGMAGTEAKVGLAKPYERIASIVQGIQGTLVE